MPSKSKAQHNLMAMVANDPKAAKRVGIPQSVGVDYMHADKGKKFGKGAVETRPDLQKINKPAARHGKTAFFSQGGPMAKAKLPPFMGKETPSEEKKEMKIKKISSKMYMEGEKREGVHGASGKEKPSKYAKGGTVDGIASKGKTKGKVVAMKKGGRCM